MVETTHIHDILRVRGIRNYFNEFLSNCLAFSRSKFVNLPHCRQHCQINPRLRCIRNPSFGIQTSNLGHIKRRLPRIHLHGIQASESKLQAAESKPAPASSTLHASFVASISTESKHQISVTSILHASPSHDLASTSKKSKLRFSAT